MESQTNHPELGLEHDLHHAEIILKNYAKTYAFEKYAGPENFDELRKVLSIIDNTKFVPKAKIPDAGHYETNVTTFINSYIRPEEQEQYLSRFGNL